MSEESIRLLAGPPLEAAVVALAQRNAHHLDAMSPAERAEAVATWRELATAVLAAAGSALEGADEAAPPEAGAVLGRAVIVFEDADEQEITVHASFYPQLEDLGDGQVSASPAQAAAIEVLNGVAGEPEPEA